MIAMCFTLIACWILRLLMSYVYIMNNNFTYSRTSSLRDVSLFGNNAIYVCMNISALFVHMGGGWSNGTLIWTFLPCITNANIVKPSVNFIFLRICQAQICWPHRVVHGSLFLDPTRPDPTRRNVDPTRPAIADEKSDPTRPAARLYV